MSTAEAAQMWAEAKDKLGAAVAAMDLAVSAHDEAYRAEREAWEALEAVAGRTPVNTALATLAAAQANGSPLTHPRARMNGGVIEHG